MPSQLLQSETSESSLIPPFASRVKYLTMSYQFYLQNELELAHFLFLRTPPWTNTPLSLNTINPNSHFPVSPCLLLLAFSQLSEEKLESSKSLPYLKPFGDFQCTKHKIQTKPHNLSPSILSSHL